MVKKVYLPPGDPDPKALFFPRGDTRFREMNRPLLERVERSLKGYWWYDWGCGAWFRLGTVKTCDNTMSVVSKEKI